MNFEIFMPTKVIFGSGELKQLGTLKLPGTKALIVISSGNSMRRSGYLDRIISLLEKQGVESVIFDKIQPNPLLDTVMEGAQFAKDNGCDFVIGLGGGSSIDSAKSIAVMATNPGDYWDYMLTGSGKQKIVENSPLPIIAVPTTAGTGTEADPWTVITKPDTHEKIGFGIEGTFPVISIVDLELMKTVPPFITAYTGIDAFCHAVEAYLATVAQPISDMLALESVSHISKYLATAVNKPNDLEAREKLAWASTAAGLCETYSCCIGNHSIEHALSAFNENLPHGVGLALVGPAFFEYIIDSQPERFLKLAKAMNPHAQDHHDFVKSFKKLINESGLGEETLSKYGFKKEQLQDIAQNSFDTMGFLFDLMSVKLDVNDVYNILMKAYK